MREPVREVTHFIQNLVQNIQNEFSLEYVVARARLNAECLNLAMNTLLVSTVSSEPIFFKREVYKTAITGDPSHSSLVHIGIPRREGHKL